MWKRVLTTAKDPYYFHFHIIAPYVTAAVKKFMIARVTTLLSSQSMNEIARLEGTLPGSLAGRTGNFFTDNRKKDYLPYLFTLYKRIRYYIKR